MVYIKNMSASTTSVQPRILESFKTASIHVTGMWLSAIGVLTYCSPRRSSLSESVCYLHLAAWCHPSPPPRQQASLFTWTRHPHWSGHLLSPPFHNWPPTLLGHTSQIGHMPAARQHMINSLAKSDQAITRPVPAVTIYWPNVALTLAHRLRGWANVNQHWVNKSCLLGSPQPLVLTPCGPLHNTPCHTTVCLEYPQMNHISDESQLFH